MPAPAVIPAPKAYIKVVAVKKFVVGFLMKKCAALRPCGACSIFFVILREEHAGP